MKIKYYLPPLLVGLLIFLVSCETKEKEVVVPKTTNLLKQFSSNQLQVFNLDTLSYKQIIGKDGTVIEFYRENFDVPDGQNLTLELREMYDFEELFYNNIQTLTNKGELLGSSGVLFIRVKANGKEVALKKGSGVLVKLAYSKLHNNKIFSGEVDNTGSFLWKEETVYVWEGLVYDPDLKIDVLIEYPLDSLDYFVKDLVRVGQREEEILNNANRFNVSITKLNWINIDRVVEPDSYLNFSIQLPSKVEKLDGFEVYFIYKGINSFINDFRLADDLRFTNIPIKDETYMVVLTGTHENNYGAKVKLSEVKNGEEVKQKMKKMDAIQLRKLLDF